MPALTVPQMLYLAAVAAYLVMFLLFLRLFLWKRYAETHYWRRRPPLSLAAVARRAAAAGQELPYFSILIPARNEADVIEHTIDHMARLEYPPDRYEVLVVTDEKEVRQADRLRPAVLAEAEAFLRAALDGGGAVSAGRAAALGQEATGLVLGLLTRLAMEGGDEIRRRFAAQTEPGVLQDLPPAVARQLAWEAARRLWQSRGRDPGEALWRLLRRRAPAAGQAALEAAYAALLTHAIPATLALAILRADPGRQRLLGRLAAHAARAHHSLTQAILGGMAEALAADVVQRLRHLAAGDPGALAGALAATYREVYPTTQDIVERKVAEWQATPGRPRLKHVQVPYDFDGQLGGRCTGQEVPSTKGRALNWGLGFIDPRTVWCGFYDAESRPDPRVLLYVAHRWLEDTGPQPPAWRPPRVDRPVRIFQGPVFQVRNFYEMGPFCKIASLYQAVAHDWYLPALFRRLPFVGGTNLFVTADLLRQIGGYDPAALTEDLELGTRAYLAAGAWPEYLPLPSSEQTPPTFPAFFRQRLRWATGHLQVMDKIRRSAAPAPERRRLLWELFRKGQCEWVFYQAATLVPPAALALHALGWLDPEVLPNAARMGLHAMSLTYVVFTLYAYWRYAPHLDRAAQPRGFLRGQALAVAHLLALPLAAFLFPVPYSSALVLHRLGLGPRTWVKTPRTRE